MAKVVIYTRKLCGFCTSAKSLLKKKGVKFTEYDASFDPKLRQEMMKRSGRNTFPQIFINGEHVGGCDDLYAADARGKLDKMLGK